jgi:RimJ/RimL family protein N-acetyltransferase
VLSAWQIQTGRLVLQPVGWSDLADLVALKGDPRAFAVMLGGVRTPVQVADELAAEMSDWARLGYGIWTIRDAQTGAFIGLTGLQNRADGRGVGLRFAVRPEQQGHGYASEAAGAALRFAHERAGLARVVAVARADNLSSRQVLGGIGMVEAEAFVRDGVQMLMFEHRAK